MIRKKDGMSRRNVLKGLGVCTLATVPNKNVADLVRNGVGIASVASSSGLPSYPELKGLSRIYVVSPEGSDQDPGTDSRPFRTISQAARLLKPGEGVLVRAGVYRERVCPERGGEPDKPVVYFAELGQGVILKGSDVWQPAWTRVHGQIYAAKPDDHMFTDDVYWDSPNPLRVALCATPWGRDGRAEYEYYSSADRSNGQNGSSKTDLQKYLEQCDKNLAFTLGQVFVNGKLFRQMPNRAEMEATPESWFYETASEQVFIHFGSDLEPSRHLVELTTRRRIFAPHQRGLGYIHVIGFVMEHCGNQYPKDFWATPEYGQAGALGTRSGHHWKIRNNIVRFANGFGIDIGAEGKSNERGDGTEPAPEHVGDHIIEDNLVTDNGAGGICGFSPKRLRIAGNVIARNNALRFKGKKRWESAGIKLHTPDNSLIVRNLFLDNYTNGIWCDQGAGKGMRFTRNVILGNSESEHGVFIEMGVYGPDAAFIDNNVIVGNRNGFYCHDGSGVTVSHNLIAQSRDYGIQVRQVGPRCNTRNHSFFNNLLVDNASAVSLNFPAELGGNVRLDGNVYHGSPSDRIFVISAYSKFNPSWTESEFQGLVEANFKPAGLDQAAFSAENLAKMTFAEWKQFWLHFSADADDQSHLINTVKLALNADTLEMVLTLPESISTRESSKHTQGMLDFDGRKVHQEGMVLAGPFQHLNKESIQVGLKDILHGNSVAEGGYSLTIQSP